MHSERRWLGGVCVTHISLRVLCSNDDDDGGGNNRINRHRFCKFHGAQAVGRREKERERAKEWWEDVEGRRHIHVTVEKSSATFMGR